MTGKVRHIGFKSMLLPAVVSGVSASVVMGSFSYALPVPGLGKAGLTFFVALAYYFGTTGAVGISIGWGLHILAGAIFGIIFAAVINGVRKLWFNDASTSMIYGLIYGIIIWAVFFLPLMILPWPYLVSYPIFLIGGLGLHMAFGLVLGAVFMSLVARTVRSAPEDAQTA